MLKVLLRASFTLKYLLPWKYPADNYMFKVNNRNTRTRYEICSKLTMKTPEQCHWRRFSVFIVNFEHISHLVLAFLLLTLSRQMPGGYRTSFIFYENFTFLFIFNKSRLKIVFCLFKLILECFIF